MATANRHDSSAEGTIVPSLLDYLRVLGRWKVVFILIVLLVPATAVAVSLSQAPTYSASAEVYLRIQGSQGASQYVDPQREAQTLAKLARTPPVVDQVLEDVPSARLDRTEFLESSDVSSTLGVDVLTFTVENSDPDLARELATAYANAFTGYQEGLDDLVSAEVVVPADDVSKVGPRTVRNGLIALCLGLVLALVVVFLADALDTRVRSVDAVREALGLRFLGRLGTPPAGLRKGDELVMLADPTSRDAEQFRALRWSLDLANAEYGARTIMITSALDAEGKSTTAANLAVALARAGRRVVLIDADLTRPYLHRFFDLDQRPGLTDIELGDTWLVSALRPIGLLEDSSGADDSDRRVERTGSLEVLPAGSALQDPDELGFEEAVGQIVQRVRGRSDVVLVDAPPLLRSNAIALSAHIDAIVVVVRLKGLRAPTLRDLGWMLEASRAIKLGFVVTGVGKTESLVYHQRSVSSESRLRAKLRPTPTVSRSAADGDGEGSAQTDSKSADRPFGGLGPQRTALEEKADAIDDA